MNPGAIITCSSYRANGTVWLYSSSASQNMPVGLFAFGEMGIVIAIQIHRWNKSLDSAYVLLSSGMMGWIDIDYLEEQ